MEHIRKEILEQIAILCELKRGESDICYQFVRNHALSIVQLSEEAIGVCQAKCPRHDWRGKELA